MNPKTNLVIETRGLTKSFDGIQALKSLDLSVPKNSIVGFLGPNGSGKSTTIKLLLGLLRPTGGGGTVFGLDIVRDSLAIRQRVGYLAQQPSFDRNVTPRELLRFTGKLFSGSHQHLERRIDDLLALVGLENKADRRIMGFSGGERQRLGIAQAQINDPDLLILDEPAAALDPMGRHDVLKIMASLRERTTIFYSTHILDDVQRVTDRVIILNQGELVAQGPIEELLIGDQGSVYSLIVEGDSEPVESWLKQQPWISGVQVNRINSHLHWRVAVHDDQIAKEHLLRGILAHPAVAVLEFGREEFELEQVFMSLVQNGDKS